MATLEPIDTNAGEEDSGFLKIANVVSLAPPKESENQIVSIPFSSTNRSTTLPDPRNQTITLLR